jgi:hypothetical protein
VGKRDQDRKEAKRCVRGSRVRGTESWLYIDRGIQVAQNGTERQNGAYLGVYLSVPVYLVYLVRRSYL